MDDARTDNVALVIEAMYQVAADPETWEQLIEALGEGGEDPSEAAARELARSEDIARLVSRPGEGPGGARRARDDIGWVLLSASRRITAANQAAELVMADGLGALRVGQPIRFDDAANDEALTQALGQARAQVAGQTILRLQRDAYEGPRFAYVVPARSLPGVLDAAAIELTEDDQAYAIVFPAVEETGRLWVSIRESFGLTPAEVRLARKLRDGKALKEAADDLDVSVNTVRNQLRAIFDKMGLKRQSDLVRALTELSSIAGVIDAHSPGGEIGAHDAPPVHSIILPDGRRLAYRDYGDPDGRTILSFHEGVGSSLLPPGTHGLARELKLRIIAGERPGFGQSDPRSDYSFDGVAEDMVILCDRLGLTRVRIGAVLSGAPSAVQTAIRLGDRAVSVSLYSGRPPRPVGAHARNTLMLFRSRIESNPWVLETFFAVLRLRISPAVIGRLLRSASRHAPADLAFLDDRPETVDFIAAYIAEALAKSSRGPADEVRAFRRGRNLTVEGLKAPVVVWHGEEDVLAPLPDLLTYLGDKASEVKIKPGVGHMLTLKHWEEILRAAAA